ncbi:MAG: 2-oxo-4-hydroxy-4-carboxy-5-ureidoimidazoline decarboxylase, partial [Cyanobacteria bacterium P01_F01_bin.143]
MKNQQYFLEQLNKMSQEEFTATLGAIREETPVIAQKSWHSRPFADLGALYQAMVAIVNNMNETEQLTLIKAHPDLGSKLKMA